MKSSWCEVTILSPQRVQIRCSYDPGFVEALKAAIPHTARTYDEATKLWTADRRYEAQLTALAETYFAVALRIDGNFTLDLHTGKITEQLTLL